MTAIDLLYARRRRASRSQSPQLEQYAYHGTSKSNLRAIRALGLVPQVGDETKQNEGPDTEAKVCLAKDHSTAKSYAGKDGVVLKVDLDHPSIPPVLKKDEFEKRSLTTNQRIPPEAIQVSESEITSFSVRPSDATSDDIAVFNRTGKYGSVVHRHYVFDQNNDHVATLSLRHYDKAKAALDVSVIGPTGLPTNEHPWYSASPHLVRRALKYLADTYPQLKFISGNRVTGALSKADDNYAEFNLDRIRGRQFESENVPYRVILWANHPVYGFQSIKVRDIPPDERATHESWFHKMGWPSSGKHFDAIDRGQAIVVGNKLTNVTRSSDSDYDREMVVGRLKAHHGLTESSINEDLVSGFLDKCGKYYHAGYQSHDDLAHQLGYLDADNAIDRGLIRTIHYPGRSGGTLERNYSFKNTPEARNVVMNDLHDHEGLVSFDVKTPAGYDCSHHQDVISARRFLRNLGESMSIRQTIRRGLMLQETALTTYYWEYYGTKTGIHNRIPICPDCRLPRIPVSERVDLGPERCKCVKYEYLGY